MRYFFHAHLQGVFKTAQQEDRRRMSSLKRRMSNRSTFFFFAFDFLLFAGYTICEPYEKENAYAG